MTTKPKNDTAANAATRSMVSESLRKFDQSERTADVMDALSCDASGVVERAGEDQNLAKIVLSLVPYLCDQIAKFRDAERVPPWVSAGDVVWVKATVAESDGTGVERPFRVVIQGDAQAKEGPEFVECKTCLGFGRIRDGEYDELKKCLNCNGAGRWMQRSRIKDARTEIWVDGHSIKLRTE